jgi:hypothetical protein
MNFDERPLSYRLARALLWFDAPAEQRRVAIDALEELGDDAADSDLPAELRQLLRWASRVAPQMGA